MLRSLNRPLLAAIACGCAALLVQSVASAQTRELATKGEMLDRVAAVVNDGVVLASELDDQMSIVTERLPKLISILFGLCVKVKHG